MAKRIALTQNCSLMSTRKSRQPASIPKLRFLIETEREEDGRWIAEINEIPGVLSYGRTEKQAKAKAYALALRVIADH